MTSCDLNQKSCKPCEGGVKPMTQDEAHKMLLQLNDAWQLQTQPFEIQRVFTFKNYYQTIAFVNALAWIAHHEAHHPDIEVSYNRCFVRYSTHAIGGLSENDFICAAKLDALL
ncbi:MAG: 4a-hydroxytetrahydrobiopterin dehydratase [Gammaproteobacteria bacterium]|nr:4a-hydroxytetrahydrobiopterin dehydratase [Gammaproteobacteria bacterium]